MNDGWIKLYRRIKDNWLYKEKRKFSKFEAWIDLLLEANHKDNKFPLGNKIVECKRGQIVTSIRKLEDKWNWSNTKINNFLNLLQEDKMIAYFSDTKKTVITIENYNLYQSESDTKASRKHHENDTKASRKHTNNNDKNVKNDKKISSGASPQKFTPPSLEEVQAYCRERNNNVDAEKWCDFYLSKNWMIGKNKMKDWKAAVRTWEKNNKDKPSTPSPKSFNNFKNREYDTDELKKRLLAKSRGEKID